MELTSEGGHSPYVAVGGVSQNSCGACVDLEYSGTSTLGQETFVPTAQDSFIPPPLPEVSAPRGKCSCLVHVLCHILFVYVLCLCKCWLNFTPFQGVTVLGAWHSLPPVCVRGQRMCLGTPPVVGVKGLSLTGTPQKAMWWYAVRLRLCA